MKNNYVVVFHVYKFTSDQNMNAFELKIQHQKDSFRTYLGCNQSFIPLSTTLNIF
jgi:hypothetical protein